ncbi:uncharacterized protein L969DRAFT_88741 [Mixia osmundae IAM 14324]|uniref:Uncharacterized protein n=1 Tax=Mixia osmundae (strain CBS 9802 / IAM 14324 / JCM 22182 / KY 12970) TaxID=764103 RepID=G7DZ88_MIXOS|nr:uncharacterized protein L969DRAFT_88741 [Mixia osmundae IAM 14324]KEI38300.1 hypothetical protein L969DRAFT_88741 [Mixia osmundae IAM 14324]GAA95898.1 hypothetical protein E5Q_02556 [Mixia osmundae IAM 14324]
MLVNDEDFQTLLLVAVTSISMCAATLFTRKATQRSRTESAARDTRLQELISAEAKWPDIDAPAYLPPFREIQVGTAPRTILLQAQLQLDSAVETLQAYDTAQKHNAAALLSGLQALAVLEQEEAERREPNYFGETMIDPCEAFSAEIRRLVVASSDTKAPAEIGRAREFLRSIETRTSNRRDMRRSSWTL